MPANRRHQASATKRAALVAVARELFLRDGYEATPMSRIADGAHVTTNTIYWYFSDKEQLLLAVLDQFMQESHEVYLSTAKSPLAQQFRRLAQHLQAARNLVTMVHALIDRSETVNYWHANFHATFEALYAQAMPRSFGPARRAAELKILAFTIEGMVSHDLSQTEIANICKGLAARWKADKVSKT